MSQEKNEPEKIVAGLRQVDVSLSQGRGLADDLDGMAAARSGRACCLAVLTAMSALNQLDRQLLSVVLEPLRREFALSDIQLGLLSGLAFAALYTALSFPAALWAVGHGRRNLIAAAAAVWGAMTVLCGFAQAFAQLFLARIGVGIGEAGGMAPAHAMISDLYRPGERAAAMAIWAAGINAGLFLAFLCGGLVAQHLGWRAAFFTAGGATVAFAAVMRFTVHEPVRALPAAAQPRAGVAETCRLLWRDPVLRHVCAGTVLTATVGYGALAWIPSFLARSHGFTIAAAGTYLAFTVGIGGALGSWLGGRYADRLGRRDIRWSLWLVAALFVGSKPFSIAFYLSESTRLALILFVVPAAVAAIFLGPSIAVLHDRVPAPRRPVASALLLLLVNLVGLGFGPLLTGAMSQVAFAAYGEDSLRYALAAMQAAGVWGGIHYWLAGRALARPG